MPLAGEGGAEYYSRVERDGGLLRVAMRRFPQRKMRFYTSMPYEPRHTLPWEYEHLAYRSNRDALESFYRLRWIGLFARSGIAEGPRGEETLGVRRRQGAQACRTRASNHGQLPRYTRLMTSRRGGMGPHVKLDARAEPDSRGGAAYEYGPVLQFDRFALWR